MKHTLITLLFFCNACIWQDIVIKKDTTVNGTWIIPTSTVVRFENNARIYGTGTIQGGIIDAGLTHHIFSTSLIVKPEGTYNGVFSCAWFGAKTSNRDNWENIQKSINVCIESGIRNCYLPKGNYHISQPLKIARIYKNQYVGVSVRFYGESEFWDARSNLIFDTEESFALGVQVGKGVEIDHLTFTGKFQSPITTDTTYYNTPIENYGSKNISYGIVIDYDGSLNYSGSTGCKFHDLGINNFQVGISVSPTSRTVNAEILSFENIRLGDMRIGFQSGQAQEKANQIKGLWSWGKIHTVIQIGQSGKYQAGNYEIDRLNIAGQCIRLFDIRQSGWYSSSISNVFAESIGTIGNLTTGDSRSIPALAVTNSTFHFAPISISGTQTLLNSNNLAVKFQNCTLRYYGKSDPMKFFGIASFNNCTFSGAISNVVSGSRIEN